MARIPNYERAVIEPQKLKDYILSASHPIGRFKEALFRQMGYMQESWELLAEDVRKQHLSQDAVLVEKTKYGSKYVITGNIRGPNGKIVRLKSLWIILEGEDFPRFITIYPGS
jgi:hypothetical protein